MNEASVMPVVVSIFLELIVLVVTVAIVVSKIRSTTESTLSRVAAETAGVKNSVHELQVEIKELREAITLLKIELAARGERANRLVDRVLKLEDEVARLRRSPEQRGGESGST